MINFLLSTAELYGMSVLLSMRHWGEGNQTEQRTPYDRAAARKDALLVPFLKGEQEA